MAKYYFRKDDEMCHVIEIHLDYMRTNCLSEMEVFKAKRETGTGYFFCQYYLEVAEVGEVCGKQRCKNYHPNNGTIGRCKHYGHTYEQTDNKILLKLE